MDVETWRFVDCPQCGDPIVDTRIQHFLKGLVFAKCSNPVCHADAKVTENRVQSGPVSFDLRTNRWTKSVVAPVS